MKCVVVGAHGRMGHMVIDQLLDTFSKEVIGGIDPKGGTYRSVQIVPPKKEEVEPLLKRADVVISFSTPEADLSLVPLITRHGKDIVIGTTGFTPQQMSELRTTIEKSSSSAVISPNFSPLVNVQIKLVAEAVRLLAPLGYQCGVIEEHHIYKKDAPSGTAKKLFQKIQENGGGKRVVYRAEGIKEWEKGDIDAAVLRLGGTAGAHDVRIVGQHGRLELATLMYSRAEFAKGAIESALWLMTHRKPGKIFDFWDVIGLS